VMIVRAGALQGGGITRWPVRTFAFFYVTGWGGDACSPSTYGNETAAGGTLVGHFIAKTQPGDGDVWGTEPCLDNELDGCVPVMTK
jgi:hypothetical protein